MVNNVCYYVPHGDTAPYLVGCTLAKYLSVNGGEIQFKFIDSTSTRASNCDQSNTLFHLPVSPWLSTRPYWKWIKAFRQNNNPILVNIHGDYITETMFSLEDRDYIGFLKKTPSALFSTKILSLFDYYVVNSSLMKELLIDRYHIDGTQIFVIPNGLNIGDDITNPYPDKDAQLVFDTEPMFNLFTHGALTRQKGIFELIDALTIIRGFEFKLFIAGSGPAKKLIQNKISSSGLRDKVIFLGKVPYEDLITKYLPKMDISIYPSKFDGFQIAALESMYFSNSVVLTSNMSGISGFMPDSLRLNIITPDSKGISNRVMQIVSLSSKEREKMIAEQKEFSRQFSWNRVADMYVDVYRKILEDYP